jgi:AcrR family transcriptional regulator
MKRKRLSPEARREQLLDVAKDSILESGVQQFSLKKLATDAMVSEQLVFHYFSSRTDLLQQLLKRDYVTLVSALNEAQEKAETLEEMLYVYACSNYDLLAEEQLVNILAADPEIATVIADLRIQDTRLREKYIVDRISESLGITRRRAAMIATMGSAASLAAAQFANNSKVSREDAVDIVTRFVAAGFESQRKK